MPAQQTVNVIGRLTLRQIEGFGNFVIFLGNGLRQIFSRDLRSTLVFRQLEFIGNRSFAIIILAGVMVGAVFGLQFGEIFRIFGAESMIGAAAGFALSKELAPVVGSFLVTARAGSAMAAEIGTMRVNEQIDAMRVMAVNPISYLVAPRMLGSILMMPLLTSLFTLAGVTSAFVIGVGMYDVDVGIFFEKIRFIVAPRHIVQGLEKAAVFGAIFSVTGCFKGFNAAGGAKGVGRATTEAVVISLVTILIVDFFISYLQFERSL